MKVFALKYKNEYLKFGEREFDVSSDYRWERDEIKDHLTIVTGTFTEDVVGVLTEGKVENV